MPQTGWLAISIFAVLNRSKADDAEVAFACRAVDIQMRRDFCPRNPEAEYQPVVFYSTEKDLPTASAIAILCTVVDDLDDDGAAAYHSWRGVPYIRIGLGLGTLSCLLSHEVIECYANPTCGKIVSLPSGKRVFYEWADPVESWTYDIEVTVLGETRMVPVSAFVTRQWFTGESGPTSFSDGQFRELAPGQMGDGGYMVVANPDGSNTNVFAADANIEAIEAKQNRPTSRMSRLVGRKQPVKID